MSAEGGGPAVVKVSTSSTYITVILGHFDYSAT